MTPSPLEAKAVIALFFRDNLRQLPTTNRSTEYHTTGWLFPSAEARLSGTAWPGHFKFFGALPFSASSISTAPEF